MQCDDGFAVADAAFGGDVAEAAAALQVVAADARHVRDLLGDPRHGIFGGHELMVLLVGRGLRPCLRGVRERESVARLALDALYDAWLVAVDHEQTANGAAGIDADVCRGVGRGRERDPFAGLGNGLLAGHEAGRRPLAAVLVQRDELDVGVVGREGGEALVGHRGDLVELGCGGLKLEGFGGSVIIECVRHRLSPLDKRR